MENLQDFGFDDWFKNRVDHEMIATHEVARVISVHRDNYTLSREGREVFAELSGNLLYRTESARDLPTVGDWVYADFLDADSHAVIYGVFPRKTLLKRKTPGKTVDIQLIAANIDVAFIIQSLNENLNPRRLERYLVMVNESGIEPVVLLSKCDLMPGEELAAIQAKISKIAPGALVIGFSNLSKDNLDQVLGLLKSGLTYCLLGSSGVGKTTLLNHISHHNYQTQAISKIQGKGRHTTTSRQLVQLENGAMIIDTPGMRELGSIFMDEGLDETFLEIAELSQNCKFSNCSHTHEKDCAILAAMKAGELSERRYQNYLKMKKESEFNRASYLEKRRKDKNFGKMVKSIIKDKNKRRT